MEKTFLTTNLQMSGLIPKWVRLAPSGTNPETQLILILGQSDITVQIDARDQTNDQTKQKEKSIELKPLIKRSREYDSEAGHMSVEMIKSKIITLKFAQNSSLHVTVQCYNSL